jgi:ATP-dependent DNA helicase DinG
VPHVKHLDVESVLGPSGPLAATAPGWERRSAQVEMAKAVAQALTHGGHLLAEAGTGTGKTLAYLVPAVLSGKRVVISTATRTLQDQLFLKDIPLLKSAGLSFDAALLKGRSNYLCLHRHEAFEQHPLFPTPEDARPWDAFSEWARRTTSGDRAEADVPDAWGVWTQLSTTSDNCLGSKCEHLEDCFVTRAREAATRADIVVVNHALFFADLALRSRGDALGLSVLPAYDAVVFDEAHTLEDVATEHFGVAVSSARCLALAQDALKPGLFDAALKNPLAAASVRLRSDAEAFFTRVQQALQLADGQELRMPPEQSQALLPEVAQLAGALTQLAALCPESDPQLGALGRRAEELEEELDGLLTQKNKGHVHWANKKGRTVALKSAPIDVGQTLKARLYEQVKTAIFTSATLAAPRKTGASNFDYVIERLGLTDEPHQVLQAASPFDWPRQAALYVPGKLPEPNAQDFTRAVADEVLELCQVTRGRAFILFTSLKQMEAVHALCAPKLKWQVLLQGEKPRRALLDEFKARPSVLFASQSFWEGVDVPGEALSLVVIDKLPFAPPSAPLTAARIDALTKAGEDAFNGLQLPQAALALRQGFGRLIRSRTDRGIVAVLDSRLKKRRYGASLLASLPPAASLDTLAEVDRWWQQRSLR